MKNKKTISVVLPAYNEEENIEDCLQSVCSFLLKNFSNFEIIVVNDGSEDRTADLVRKFAQSKRCVRLISHCQNRGHGAALRSGFQEADSNLIFYTDADNQFDIKDLKRLLPLIDKNDIVAAYRRNRHDPPMRVFIGYVYNFLMRSLFGLKIKDIDCSFKLFKSRVFKKIKLRSKTGFLDVELFVKARQAGFSVVQIGVCHFPRKKGKTSYEIEGGNRLFGFVKPRVVWDVFKEMGQSWGELQNRKRNQELIIFISLFLSVFLLKAPFLNLPFHFDEISSYNSVKAISANNLNPFVEYWGYHPPLVFGFVSLYHYWFGISRVAVRLLLASFSFLTLWFTYLLAKRLYYREVGLWAAFLLLNCPLFFAQSGLFHLDVFLTAFSMAAFYFYFSGRKKRYLVASSLAVLTKETGVFIVASIFAWEIYRLFRDKKLNQKNAARATFYLLPGFVFVAWMILNKILLGWFIWPVFLGEPLWPTGSLFQKFSVAFLADGRWLITGFFLAVILVLAVSKKLKATFKKDHRLFFLVLPLVVFLSLSWGVFLPRYILFVYPLWLILFIDFGQIFFKRGNLKRIIFLMMTLIFIYEWFAEEGPIVWGGEMDLSYLHVVATHKKALRFIENRYPLAKILTTNTMYWKFKEPNYGYVSKKLDVFTLDEKERIGEAEILVVPDYLSELPDNRQLFELKNELQPLETFSSGREAVFVCQF